MMLNVTCECKMQYFWRPCWYGRFYKKQSHAEIDKKLKEQLALKMKTAASRAKDTNYDSNKLMCYSSKKLTFSVVGHSSADVSKRSVNIPPAVPFLMDYLWRIALFLVNPPSAFLLM
ncbi:hypothetical protein CEXT_37361 [Caerostris extrusa]|uniref:Uncharacterized protein n=1 Tax=Caerostris extrusa TaxID=172846 RepID=A0AAV4RTT7_CAEEX|nr:hypothetical protein CEXT_37361 [Caerostris extrusa]